MSLRALASIFSFLVLFAAGAHAQGQSDARVTTRLSSGVVKFGGEVQLIATIENATVSEVRPLPQVDGLRISQWGAAATRIATSVALNGRVVRSEDRTWTATVRPERKGEFVIPALEFAVDGGLVHSQPLTLNVVEDLKGEELGHFSLRASSNQVVEGQPFTIELVFGWDGALRERVNWANLSLPWWGQLAGAIENAPPPLAPGATQVEISLNSTDTLRVEELPKGEARGRPFRMFRLVRSFTPTRAGSLEFPSSWLEFGRVVDSGDIFTRRRERVETFFVRSEPVTIEVIELPEQGRPADFGGAIGNFVARATAEPRDVDAGESIKLAVEWSGTGNLEFFSAPEPSRSDAFHGFRVYGKTETKSFGRRSVTYDLAPKSAEVKQIPPLVLPVFDPKLRRYTTVATEAIPIRVRALARASGLSDAASGFVPASDLRDVESSLAGERDASGPGTPVVLAAFAVLPFLWLALRAVARTRANPWTPLEKRRRRARRELERELARARTARDELTALQSFLGARTAEPAAAWQGRDVGRWFAEERPEVPRDAVQELERLIAELESAAWGGGKAAPARERAPRIAERLVGGGL